MLTLLRSRRIVTCAIAIAVALPAAAITSVAVAGPPQLIHNAACDGYKSGDKNAKDATVGCETKSPIAGFTGAVDAIISPAVWVVLALVPIACIYGAGSLLFGGHKGLPIIGGALAIAVFMVSLRGIIA